VQLRHEVKKMFCGCSHGVRCAANTQVCPVCLGLPGRARRQRRRHRSRRPRRARTRLRGASEERLCAQELFSIPISPRATNLTIRSAARQPSGTLSVPLVERGVVNATIVRLHIEEDAGKSIHDRFAQKRPRSISIARACRSSRFVGGPDLRSPAEARAYLQTLKQLLEYIGISDCDMEKGSLRVDGQCSRCAGRRKPRFSTRTELEGNTESPVLVSRAFASRKGRLGLLERENARFAGISSTRVILSG